MKNQKSELSKIVGSNNVIDDPVVLESYSKDGSFSRPMMPRMVVKVKNVQEVQKIVRWANNTMIPLVPVSSGPPHYKGDTVPGVPEALIVDLSGMKKIISINRQHRVCIVEPGVTYGELNDALAKERMVLATSMAPRSTKSVVASVLENEPRLNGLCQWEFFEPLRCVEVVWGDGNRMYTGEAAMAPLDLEKQWAGEKWQVAGNGPGPTDFFRMLTMAQGTMGIVTWASLRCELMPAIHKMFYVPAQKLEDLTEFVRRVIRLRFSDELLVMNNTYMAAILGNSPDEVKKLKAELPQWTAVVGILGRELLPELRVETQELDIADIAQLSGLKMRPALPGISGERILQKLINPSGDQFWKEVPEGAFQDVFFLTTLDNSGEYIQAMNQLADSMNYPVTDIGVYIQPKHRGSSYHLEFYLPYDPSNIKGTEKVKQLFIQSSKKMSSMGAYFSRPYGLWSQLQLNKDAQGYMILKDLKGIFDPNNIMNPGKLTVD